MKTRILCIAGLLVFGCGGLRAKKPQSLDARIGVCSDVRNAQRLKAAGADCLEAGVSAFLVPDKPEEAFDKNLALLRESGSEIVSCNGFLPASMIVVGPSTDHDKILAWAETTFRRAERAGIRYIVFGSGKSRKVPDGFSRETAEEQFVQLCKRLGPVAARSRATVVIEPLNSRETNLINSVSEGASIVERVNHKNIRLLCDLFHMTADGEPPQAIVDAGKHIRHCHIAEAAERNHAMLVRDGYEMTASDRMAAVGGQVATLTTPNGTYEGVPIAKFGEHQAHNALAALAASEVVIPVNGPLDGDLVAEALSSVKIPGRIEQIRTSPTIILDGGHNVNAAEALRKAIEESYDFKQLVGVVAMMRDKQVEEYLGVLEPILSSVVVTENSWRERVMPADELEKIAVDVFGRDRVIKEANLPDAIQTAVNMVDAEDELGVGYGHGVLICGSFVTAGDARLMLEEHASPTMRQAMAVHQPAVDPDDSDQPADKAEDEAADNLEDSVSPDDFDVFDVLGLGKEQASDAGNAGTGTASADTDTDDSADAR